MKFFHLSDLHIGKHLHHYNLKKDQEFILQQIVSYAEKEMPDAIIIAGDIYDKSAPSAEAVSIFDAFLTALSSLEPGIPILIISGNHDSAQRLDYASGILKKELIHIAGMPPVAPEDSISKITLEDTFGLVNFYLLPFVKPSYVRGAFPGVLIENYDTAVRMLLEREKVDSKERNVLVSHQLYMAGGAKPMGCDSESIVIGGLEHVDIKAVEAFDYVALGHMHEAQGIGQPWIRYSGSPMKYSVSESGHEKSITVVTLGEKHSVPVIETLALKPLHDICKITGTLEDICEQWGQQVCEQDYVSITLTDETELYKPKDELSTYFSRILEVKVDNSRTRAVLENMEEVKLITDPCAIFGEFFQEMQGRSLSTEEQKVLQKIIQQVKEGEDG